MLFRVETSTRSVHRVEGRQLRDFGISERDFQAILFDNIERFLPDEELLTIAQSRKLAGRTRYSSSGRRRTPFHFRAKGLGGTVRKYPPSIVIWSEIRSIQLRKIERSLYQV